MRTKPEDLLPPTEIGPDSKLSRGARGRINHITYLKGFMSNKPFSNALPYWAICNTTGIHDMAPPKRKLDFP